MKLTILIFLNIGTLIGAGARGGIKGRGWEAELYRGNKAVQGLNLTDGKIQHLKFLYFFHGGSAEVVL